MNISHLRKAVLYYSLLLVVAFTAVLAGCERQEQERTSAVRPVRILTIGDGSIGRSLAYSGQIRAGETAELGFEVAGRIIELPVKEGQQVNEGDMLARLDPADYQAGLNQAEAELVDNQRQRGESFTNLKSADTTGEKCDPDSWPMGFVQFKRFLSTKVAIIGPGFVSKACLSGI